MARGLNDRNCPCDLVAAQARTLDPANATIIPSAEIITIKHICEAAKRIRHYIKRTPTLHDHHLSSRFGTNVYVKYEILQHTGAFKVRGAFNKMLSLSALQTSRGVVAVSGGNHSQAVAYAGRRLGIPVVALMPEFTPENYVRQTLEYGARVEKFPTLKDAFAAAEMYQRGGSALIHPFDDEEVVTGQGTVGLEIFEDVPDVTDVIVSIGGGGLAGGCAVALKSANPNINVWGAETEGADSMARALEAGAPVDIGEMTSIARTLGATRVGDVPFSLVRKFLSGVTVVSDREAVNELFWLIDKCKVLTEAAASCTLAVAERLKGRFTAESHVVLVLCGGNLGLTELFRWGLDKKEILNG